MIHYFQKLGDTVVTAQFDPYIWSKEGTGISNYLGESISETYGQDLKSILIMYYVDGRFKTNGPDEYKLGNYSSEEKSIAVSHTISPMFWNMTESDRKQYIADSTRQAVLLVKEKLRRRKLDVDFDALEHDLAISFINFVGN